MTRVSSKSNDQIQAHQLPCLSSLSISKEQDVGQFKLRGLRWVLVKIKSNVQRDNFPRTANSISAPFPEQSSV